MLLFSDTKFHHALGAILKAERLKRGLSQTQAGNVCAVSFQQWQKYESGRDAVSLTSFLRVCIDWNLQPRKIIALLMEGN